MEGNGDNRKSFYVVQFIEEKPFEGIDDYVCVPYTWVVIRRETDKKVVVAYPNNELPIDTRERVKRKERYSDKWRFYSVKIKYETDTYKDAAFWLMTRSDNELSDSGIEDAPQPIPTSSSESRNSSRNSSKSKNDKQQLKVKANDNFQKPHPKKSLKRSAQTESKKQHDETCLALNKVARSIISACNYAIMEPGCSKREQSIVTAESDHTEKAVEPSSSRVTGEKHRSPPVSQAKEQQPSMPVIDANEPTEVIDIKKEDHNMQGERQPTEINSSSQSQLSMATPQLPTAAALSPHLDQHDHGNHLQDRENLYSNFQPLLTDVRSIRANDNNRTTATDEISNNESNVSHHLPRSLKTCARIYSEMKERPSLGQPKPVEEKIRLMNSVRNMAIALQNPSNQMDQTRSPTVRQSLTITQIQSQDVPCLKKKIGTSHDMTAFDPRIVIERVDDVTSASKHIPIPPQRPSYVRRINRLQNSPAQEQSPQQPMDVQNAPQRPGGSHSIGQRASFEDGLMNKASTMPRFSNPSANQHYAGVSHSYQNNPGNSHQEQQRQELLRRSTEENIAALRFNTPLTISIPAVKLISTNIANQMNPSLELSLKRQLPPYYQDLQHQLRPSEAEFGAPIKAKNDREKPTLQGVTKRSPPPVQTNIRKSIKQAPSTSQSDVLLQLQRFVARLKGKSIENHPGLPASSRNVIPASTSDIGSVETLTCSSHQSLGIPVRSVNKNVHQFPLTQERLIHEPYRTTMKRVYFEDNIVNSSAARSPPRAMDNAHQTDESMVGEPLFPNQDEASNSEVVADHEAISDHEMSTGGRVETTNDDATSTDNQTHSGFVLEQQLLDSFSTLFTQMGSTFEMYKNLRGSILESADTYKKILEVVERCNALVASASAASSSSNAAPTISPVTEERQTRVTDRGNSSSNYQYSNDSVNAAPETRRVSSWRIVLPPEYDPRDSKWTLKYQKIVPGLTELMPQSGIYVSYQELKYSERVSNNCKTLAQLVLLEVFSKNALSVCLLFSGSPQAANAVVGSIVRPELYQHACAVLFNFILRYGLLHDWEIDTGEILNAIDSKMQEIRTNYGVIVECL